VQNIFDYTSKETFDLENRNLFDPFFHFGAHQSELSNFGDFIQINAAEKDILLINDHGIIKAFENSCPHRGCRLIDQQVGNVEKVICPYHGWQFQEGKVFIPSLKDFEDAALETVTLHYYSIEFCGDFIFFFFFFQHSLKEQIGIFWDDLEMMSYDITNKVDTNNQDFHANWKISLENALESYHVSSVHSSSLGLLGLTEGKVTFDGVNSLWESSTNNSRLHNKLLKIKSLFNNSYQKESYFSLYLFPYSMISSTYGYSYAFQTFFPKISTETQFSSRTYATKTPYISFFEDVIRLNHKIFAEDAHICQLVQKGASSSSKFVYSKQEQRIVAFHSSYAKGITA